MSTKTWQSIRGFPAGAAERILLWITLSAAVSALLYHRHAVNLLQKVSEIVPGETQIYPIAGIVFVGAFTLFRLWEIWGSLEKEAKLNSEPKVRLAGLLLALAPAASLPDMPLDMDVSASILATVWLGVFTAINPQTSRLLMPYTALYVAATLSPKVVYPLAGEPLADYTALIVGYATKALSIPVLQSGRSLEFTSLNGETIRLTISPNCSSISSITVFLLLCGLMHLDLRKRISTTLLLATFSTAILVMLNAIRIVILLSVGYVGGEWSMWNVHRWLGYTIMIGFYTIAAKIYIKIGEHKKQTINKHTP